MEALKESVESNLKKYVAFAQGQGIPASYRMAIGTEAVSEAEKLCLKVAEEFPLVTFFAGKILFQEERWYQNILHNETAMAIQKLSSATERLFIASRYFLKSPPKMDWIKKVSARGLGHYSGCGR